MKSKKIIILALGVIISGGLLGFGYYCYHNGYFDSKKLYKSSNGVIDFSYPATFSVAEEDGFPIYISDTENKLNQVRIGLDNKSVFLGKYEKSKIEKIGAVEGTSILKIPADNDTIVGGFKVGSYIVLDLGEKEGIPLALIFIVYSPDANSLSIFERRIERLVQSSVVHNTELQKYISSLKTGGQSATIKATISGMRGLAEFYFSKYSSYQNICETGSSKIGYKESDFKRRIDLTNTMMGTLETACASDKELYSFSTVLPNKEIWCIDNTGFMGKVEVLSSRLACQGAK